VSYKDPVIYLGRKAIFGIDSFTFLGKPYPYIGYEEQEYPDTLVTVEVASTVSGYYYANSLSAWWAPSG